MINAISNFLIKTVFWGFKQVLSIIKFGWPYALRVVFFTLGIALQLSVLNLLAMIKGVGPVAEKVSDDWTEEAIERGRFPSLWELSLRRIFYFAAVMTICLGWLVNLLIVVFTVDLLYRWLF